MTINNIKISSYQILILLIGIIISLSLFTGCASLPGKTDLKDYISPSPEEIWVPSSKTAAPDAITEIKTEIPEGLMKQGAELPLSDIISIALQNNPDTKAAWHSACSAAYEWLSQRGDYYPEVTGYVSASHAYTYGNGTSSSVTSFDPSLQLTWLIFDMGGRDAGIEEKYHALLAADFTHNSAIQDAVFQVIDYYYGYAGAKAARKACETSLKDAEANLEAAKQRHDNGLATIADVLQMKTALSQAQVKYDAADGEIRTIRGALATAMGLPASTDFDTGELPLNPKVDSITETVDSYIKKAQENRPDLAAQRSEVEAAMAKVRSAHSARYPSLSFTDSLGGGIDNRVSSKWENQNAAMLRLSIPIFQGDSLKHNELKAQEDVKNQKAKLEKLEQTIIYEVWSSYFTLKTAAQQVETNDDLMESAQASYDVALGRYKEGVGGYLDLLSAQSALESARSQRVILLTEWYISLAQLARYTGTLWQQTDEGAGAVVGLFPDATIKDQKP